MTKIFLVKVDLPDWHDDRRFPEQMERVRDEIEKHAGAAAAFYTRAVHISVRCEVANDKIGAQDRLNALTT